MLALRYRNIGNDAYIVSAGFVRLIEAVSQDIQDASPYLPTNTHILHEHSDAGLVPLAVGVHRDTKVGGCHHLSCSYRHQIRISFRDGPCIIRNAFVKSDRP